MAMANLAWILQVSSSNKHEIYPFHSCNVIVFLPSIHTIDSTQIYKQHTQMSLQNYAEEHTMYEWLNRK